MRRLWLALVLAPISVGAEAQTHVEVQGGMTIGSYSNSRAGLEVEPRVSFDVLVRQTLAKWISMYGGYSRMQFGCAEHFCQGRPQVVTGNHGTAGGEVSWRFLWARAGGMMGVAQIQDVREPKFGFGMQAAFGGRVELFGMHLTQGVSLERMQARHLDGTDWATAISIDLGVGYPLPF